MEKSALFISGGNIDVEFAASYIRKHPVDYVIAVDKGLEFCDRYEIHPDIIVGDFDSLPSGFLEKYEQDPSVRIKRLIPEKDDSDTESAMHTAFELQVKTIFILGGTGSRLDHMQANLQLLGYAYARGVRIYLVDAHNCASIADRSMVLKASEQFGRFVSFFACSDVVEGLTLRGFKYPLREYRLTNLSCGLTLSNEIAEETAEVTYTAGLLMMIQTRD
ncbi:MAG: thiamine diphosphokinase [Lachnospiraceae bacterium]|nr:thiamine diphosphokinase [Lachnospiraceae bacterium]